MESVRSTRVLYISYTGLLEPLGQSQVYRYLDRLAEKHDITLVTFEKPDDIEDTERFESLQEKVENAGIEWHPLQYHHSPTLPATAWDLARGFATSVRAIRQNDTDIVHARSYVPSVLALLCKRFLGTKFVFDMRGFWADERVDGDIWESESTIYKLVKRLETQFITHSDVLVSLTDAGIEAIRDFDHVDTDDTEFRMIPTCVDLDLFSPEPTEHQNEFTLGYVGSVGTWYLFDEVLDCFELLRERKPDARLSILNKGDHDLIREKLQEHGIDDSVVSLTSVRHEEVPEEMNRMDAGIFLIRPVFSKRGSCPTKMGEFLGCGVPCLGNAGVGDVASILEGEDVGVAIDGFSEQEKQQGVDQLLALTDEEEISNRCRSVAEQYFSLESGVQKYDEIYRSLITSNE